MTFVPVCFCFVLCGVSRVFPCNITQGSVSQSRWLASISTPSVGCHLTVLCFYVNLLSISSSSFTIFLRRLPPSSLYFFFASLSFLFSSISRLPSSVTHPLFSIFNPILNPPLLPLISSHPPPPSLSEVCWEMCQCIRACSSSNSMVLYSNMDWGEAGRAVTAVNSVHKGQCTALGPDTVMRWNKTGLKIKIH